ncbi:GAG-pre-integrase domain [Arabidopsis suecica]|uniref:GAG-pre-integrase domain n=1 Tax=Arabidopsis suecica TaxID=45249 RepID=A0A8T1YP01_ARASU|nr:GAG-pre-integrase domain [Arabidopsis suecica]
MENTKIRALVTLKGGNYLLWASTMKTILCGRGFWPHIIKSEAPRETTTNEEGLEIVLVDEDKWFQEGQMVLSVLQNSLEASILEGYSYCETPKDLWETLQNVFGNQSNLSRVFEIKKAINELTQGDMEFTQHFGKFRSLWAELEMLRPNTLDPAVINERREQDKVFGLLFTLNPGYNDLIKHLLRADKLQNLEEVCSQIQKEQGSLGLFGSKGELVSGNSSELASANRGNFNTNRGKAPWCDHCKKSGHAKEKCWILHPHLRPARREPRANHATGENLGGQEQAGTSSQALGGNGAAMMASSDLVRRSDLDALIKALKESSGNAYHALSSLKPLIVDSGASHHMISDSKLMKNIEPALGNVIIANGDKIPVKGLGDLELFSKKFKAFYMPTFTSNLLSVKKATTDLNCYAIFGPNDVHFQDIETSRVLGHGGTKDGLYVLEDTKLSTPLASHFSSVLVNANNAIWHARLGHPHSRALGLLLPSISFKNDECEACILGEQRNKLDPKSVKGMFIGYSITQKGYKCYIPETKKVLVSRDVKFVESKGYYEDKNWEDIQDLTHSPSDRANNLRIILERLGVSNSQGHTNSPNPNPEPTQQQETSQHEEEEHLQEEENIQANIQENILEEGEIPSDHEEETTLSEEENLSTSDHNDGSTSQEAPIALRRSERLKFPPSNWKNTRVYYNSQAVAHPIQAVCTIAHFPEEHQVFLGQIDQHWIPQTYEEAIQHQVWRDAIAAERQAMEHNHTWEEGELPRGKKAVTSKWVFTIKYKSNGDIERYKARLVARGFTQTYGEDYRDTFAPVAKLHTVRVVLSLATNLEWELWQMDVKNAFLQGELEEEVYMKPPPGLEDQNAPGKVFKLKKAIYGLKQSPRAWYHKLSTTLLDRGFKKSEADNTLFTLPSKEGIVVILVYVDDIIISGNDKVGIHETKAFLKSVFDIKDLGELKYFLGIEVCRSKEGLFLSQRKYTLDLLSQVGKLGAKPAKTPLEDDYKANRKGELDNKPFEDVTQYRRLVGKLIYLTITRPDICFAVNVVSQHMQAPTLHHWNMVTRILKYLKGAPGQGIWMGCNKNTELVGYCDADYAGDTKDRRSTTGYCTFIGGNLVTWRSKKQKVVSLSSAEAEYRAMRKLTTELMWLKALLKDFGIDTPKPITMHCDNQAAIHIASNSVFHERAKHIEVDCHKVREQVQLGVILPCYTESEEQLADIFTKGASTKIRALVTLKGGNYLLWASTMKTILCGRGFWPHIIKSEAPRETTTNEEGLEIVLVDEDKWFQEGQMVLSVLQNSLEASILEGYSYCETPKDLWETLQNVFGNQSNLSRVFEIKKAINELTQGDMEFTQHFGKFRSLWAELEMLRPNTLDPAVINERREQDKVFGLLFTLNPGYNDLIKHLLRADKLQNLEEVCSQIQKEQGSLGLFGSKGELVSGNSSELASANRGNFNTNRGKAPWCDHCKKSGHAKEKCWILHPHLRPARREPRANHATGENLGGQEQAGTSSQALGGNGAAMMASSDLVRRSDLDALIKALKESSGNAYHALSSLKPLIVDSGASHHMISDSKLMKNIEPALGNVIIANGDKIPVKGLGDLELFSKKFKAFYMPTFTSNLLSVKKATTDLNCYAIFGPNDVHFQDIETSRVLGHGGTKDGLYVLEDTKLSTPLASHFSSVLVNANNAIWHARLGHPHSRALGLLLPSISFKNDECEACILGEQRNKLDPKSVKGMFIGYSITQKGYTCYIPETKKVLVSRDVKFVESKGYYEYKNWEDIQDLTHSPSDRANNLRIILERLGVSNSQGHTNSPYPNPEPTQQQETSQHEEEEHLQEEENIQANIQENILEEGEIPSDHEEETTLSEEENLSTSDHNDGSTSQEAPIALRRSERLKFPPSNWKNTRVYYNSQAVAHPIQAVCTIAHFPEEHQVFLGQIDQHWIPQTYEEAIQHQVWRDAIAAERQAMEHNHTWEEGELPRGKKAVTSKWVFTIKYKSNGDIERYKARLVARGFTQTYGEDYRDTFAPVAKLHTVRVVLSLATNLEWELWQMDVKNAFLQGELEEEVYMKPPPGLEDHNAPGKVFKLKKAIYGLKQSPRAWYHKLSTTLLDRGFKKSEADNTLFTLPSKEGIVVILVYVDDIIISGNDKVGIHETKAFLKSVFDIKDLGELKYFLGIEVCRSKEGLFLSQRKYTLDLLSQVGKLGAKPAKTPLEDDYKANRKGELDNKPFEDVTQYRRLVGKLIYLTITRPDICFAVNVVSQHMQAPTLHHWNMVTRILKYLKGAPGQGIWMGCNKNTELVGYCDVDYAGDTKDRRSTTGYCTFIGGNLVTWRSKKQKVVSLSSAEAEYRAMRKLTTELMWLKALLKDFGIDTPKPITMHCDNQAAIHIASNSVFHERTKHIEVDCHKVREQVQLGVILPCYTESEEQLADIFTKGASTKFYPMRFSTPRLAWRPASLIGRHAGRHVGHAMLPYSGRHANFKTEPGTPKESRGIGTKEKFSEDLRRPRKGISAMCKFPPSSAPNEILRQMKYEISC